MLLNNLNGIAGLSSAFKQSKRNFICNYFPEYIHFIIIMRTWCYAFNTNKICNCGSMVGTAGGGGDIEIKAEVDGHYNEGGELRIYN